MPQSCSSDGLSLRSNGPGGTGHGEPPGAIRENRVQAFHLQGDVGLFIEHSLNFAGENEWTEKTTLIHLMGCLEGPAKSHGRGVSVDAIIVNLKTTYGALAQQAKESLLSLRRDPKRSDYALKWLG